MSLFTDYLRRFIPHPVTGSRSDHIRSALGACFGILLTGFLSYEWANLYQINPVFMIAPMGASAVILFCLPSSPLAQPWAMVGGNLISAICGVFFAQNLDLYPVVSAGLAMFFAIGAMFVFRCIHPPSGAVALTAVLGGPAIHDMGYQFIFWPVLSNSVILILVACIYHRCTHRAYPVVYKISESDKPEHMHYQFGFKQEDLKQAMKQIHEVIDISESNLHKLLQDTEMIAYQRKIGEIKCGQIMQPATTVLEYGDHLEHAWDQLRSQQYPAIPVINKAKRVIGLLSNEDFMRHAQPETFAKVGVRFKHLIRRTFKTHSQKPEVVGQIMTSPVVTISQDVHIIHAIPLVTTHHLYVIPVVNEQGFLVGILSQTDIIHALYK